MENETQPEESVQGTPRPKAEKQISLKISIIEAIVENQKLGKEVIRLLKENDEMKALTAFGIAKELIKQLKMKI